MMKKIIALMIISVMFLNTAVFAEDYWTEVNDDIQTGEGMEENSGEIIYGNIEDYINNGWSDEFAEVPEKIEDYVSPYQNDIDLVLRLGIMDNSAPENSGEAADFRPLDKLTYYEYAKAIKNLTEYSNIDISGLENVQNIVTCDTVIKDMVTLLGYDYFLQGKSYGAVAEDCGLLDDIALKSSSAITREQFAKIISNALVVDMVKITIGNEVTYEIVEGNTILSKMNVTEIKGWLNANENTNMYSLESCAEGSVQIDSKTYIAGKSGAKNYLGRYVTAYVMDDDGEETIVKVDVNEKKDNFLSITDEDIESISKTGIEYIPRAEDGTQLKRNKTEKFDMNGNIIYNGKYAGTVASFDENMLFVDTGKIEISDTDFNGAYDIIFIWDYETVVIDQIAGTRASLKDDKGIIDLSDDDKKVIITLDGEEISVEDLAGWNVLSVAKTIDEDMYTILVGSRSVRGVYETTDEDEIVLEDDSRYMLDKSFNTDLESKKEYTFYLTAFGKVAIADVVGEMFTKTGTGRNYGYLRKCYFSDDDEEAATFRIFRLSDSSWATLEAKEKINFYSGTVENETGDDEKKVTKERLTPAEAARRLSEPQLIVFETNIEGKISSITTAVDLRATGELNDDVFAYNRRSETNIRTYYGGYFGGIYHGGTYLILRVPQDRSQEKYYGLESVKADGNVVGPMDIYDVNEAMTLSGVIVRYTEAGSGVSGRGDAQIIIDKIQKSDVNGETEYKVTALGGKEYYIAGNGEEIGQSSVIKKADGNPLYYIKTADELKKGDMLCANVDDLGYITGFRVDLRISEIDGLDYFSYTSGDTPPNLSYDYGIVKKNPAGSNIVINTSADISNDLNNKPKVVNNIMYSYDRKTGKFEKLDSKNDILPGDVLVTSAVYYYNNVQAVVIK